VITATAPPPPVINAPLASAAVAARPAFTESPFVGEPAMDDRKRDSTSRQPIIRATRVGCFSLFIARADTVLPARHARVPTESNASSLFDHPSTMTVTLT
jgi:hypothetical protein